MGERERYSILGPIARGGMAQVYLGRMAASAGFSRLVAIKRLHDTLSEDREFVAMLLDEARLTERIRHTNVVDILDVVVRDGAFALVLEWVEGASLSVLFKRARKAHEPIPLPIVLAIMQGVLRGLAAAHEARAEDGQPLGIVHRDVSPQNVLVGVDGIPRIIDFGVAKASGKLESTRPGEIHGKYRYMAPEQLMGRPVTAQADVYAAGVIMWELLTGRRLFDGDDERAVCAAVIQGDIRKPSVASAGVPPELDAVVLRATARELSSRYFDAREMLAALQTFERAPEEEVGGWVRSLVADTIEAHRRLVEAAAGPASERSLEALLAELGPSQAASSPSLSSRSVASGPPSVPGPISNLDVGDATGRQRPPTPSARPSGPWILAVAGVASLTMGGLLVGVASMSRASIRRDAPSTAASEAVAPQAAETRAIATTTGIVPSAAAAPEPAIPEITAPVTVMSSSRPRVIPRPRTSPTPAPSPGDPTDRR